MARRMTTTQLSLLRTLAGHPDGWHRHANWYWAERFRTERTFESLKRRGLVVSGPHPLHPPVTLWQITPAGRELARSGNAALEGEVIG